MHLRIGSEWLLNHIALADIFLLRYDLNLASGSLCAMEALHIMPA